MYGCMYIIIYGWYMGDAGCRKIKNRNIEIKEKT